MGGGVKNVLNKLIEIVFRKFIFEHLHANTQHSISYTHGTNKEHTNR